MTKGAAVGGGRWIWFDIENTPQVLFLEPFIRSLREDGHDVRVTAKPQAQTLELAKAKGIEVAPVGRGNFAGLVRKITGGVERALALATWARRQIGTPGLQIQSSRSGSLAARLTGVPTIGLLDYEGALHWPLALACRSLWFPDLLRDVRFGLVTRRVARFYPGLKENLYLDGTPRDRDMARRQAGVRPEEFFVVARPPAETAHYASAESWRWWSAAIDRLRHRPNAKVLVVPRDQRQGERIRREFQADHVLSVAREVRDGPSLALAADLVVGGGGTMNREAAVLGTPAWSTFAGPRPGVDEGLAREGRLRWVLSEADLESALAALGPRPAPRGPYPEGIAMIMSDIRRYLAGAVRAPGTAS